MDIKITEFFNDCAPMDYSASQAEIGRDAAKDTWRACCEDSADNPLLTTHAMNQAFIEHMEAMGFSEAAGDCDNPMIGWPLIELNALFIQLVAGDMREAEIDGECSDADWLRYEADENAPGNIFKGDDDEIYYTLST